MITGQDELAYRIERDPELREYEELLRYDWPNWDEHYEWACTTPVEEIVSWAKQIESEGEVTE